MSKAIILSRVSTLNQDLQQQTEDVLKFAAADGYDNNNIEIIEDIAPVYDITVTLNLPKEIKNVYLALQKTEIPFTCENGKVMFTVDKVDCHQMVVLEY